MSPQRLLAVAAAAGCLLSLCAPPLFAQTPLMPAPSRAGTPGFLTDFRFHVNLAALATDDPRFTGAADIGGDVDLIDFGRGRVNFLGNFEAVLGEELQAFDPNQGNYTLDVLVTFRVAGVELGGVFHHVSRHLGDRAKDVGIAWNMVGGQVLHRGTVGRVGVETSGRAMYATNRGMVDYRTQVDAVATLTYAMTARVTLVGQASGVVVGVEHRVLQRGGRLEAGVRLRGRAAALELFGGVERRLDADPFERIAHTWPLLGFRLTN